MDRDAHVRAARRREALDALEFERQREVMLAEQLGDILAEADGPGLDASLFEQMSEEDASLVAVALGQVEPVFDPDEEDEEEAGFGDESEDGAGVEEEAARLQEEIESSQRIQAALSRYLDLLAVPAGPEGDG